MPGQLFTHYFLTDGIKATDEWKTSVSQPDTFDKFSTDISDLLEKFARFKAPNEAVTEQDIICSGVARMDGLSATARHSPQ